MGYMDELRKARKATVSLDKAADLPEKGLFLLDDADKQGKDFREAQRKMRL